MKTRTILKSLALAMLMPAMLLTTACSSDDDEICEKSNGAGHGLVLCLKNAASGVAWSTNTSSQAFTGNAFVTDATGLKRSTGVSGYSATAALAADFRVDRMAVLIGLANPHSEESVRNTVDLCSSFVLVGQKLFVQQHTDGILHR